MKSFAKGPIILLACVAASSALGQSDKKPPKKPAAPTVKSWIEGKLKSVVTGCIGEDNVKTLIKKGPIVPPSLMEWETFNKNLSASTDIIQPGSAGKFMGQVFDSTTGKPVLLRSSLLGTSYPPRAVASDRIAVTHTQNCLTMLAGKGNLKLSAVILQAALDATYAGTNTQALVLDGGSMTSAYAWALDDASSAKFPGLDRSEVMLDMWAWYLRNPTYAANTNLSFYSSMSAIEAHLVKDVSVESLLKGSASASGGIPFLSASAEGNGSAKVMTDSKSDGFETAVFSKTPMAMPTASILAARLAQRLHLEMEQGNQIWVSGTPVKLTARLASIPQTACENSWAAQSGTLDNVTWDEKTRTCRFDMTFNPTATTADTVILTVSLKSTVGTDGPSIQLGQNVILSNEAAKISFALVTPNPGELPPAGSAAKMPLSLMYRVTEKNRSLDNVVANYPLTFKCGGDPAIQILIKDAHVVPGTGTKDVAVLLDVPASALTKIAQTPVSCTVDGKLTVKSTATGGALVEDKTLPTSNFDLVRPAAPAEPQAKPLGGAEAKL